MTTLCKLVYARDRTAAINGSLFHRVVYHFPFGGLVDNLNPNPRPYSNRVYEEIMPVFGQTADDLKVRLGCNQERRFLNNDAGSIVGSLIGKTAAEFLLPERRRPTTHHLFRDRGSCK